MQPCVPQLKLPLCSVAVAAQMNGSQKCVPFRKWQHYGENHSRTFERKKQLFLFLLALHSYKRVAGKRDSEGCEKESLENLTNQNSWLELAVGEGRGWRWCSRTGEAFKQRVKIKHQKEKEKWAGKPTSLTK